jgi:hypothetical protein
MSLDNIHDSEVLPTLLNPLRRKLGRVYADGANDSKASYQLIAHIRRGSLYSASQECGVMGKGTSEKRGGVGDAQGALEEDVGGITVARWLR